MTDIKVNYKGRIFDGVHSVTLEDARNGKNVSHTITIPKTREAIDTFISWPRSQGVYFECHPSGTGDYFLVDESPVSYIFK